MHRLVLAMVNLQCTLSLNAVPSTDGAVAIGKKGAKLPNATDSPQT